jgi:hypothetical protein
MGSRDPVSALELATKEYVDTYVVSGAPVQSVAGRTGAVTLTHTDITDWASTLAPYALLASPALTGNPTAPTVTPPADNSTKLATTAFVHSAISAISAGVTSWNARSGDVTMTTADLTPFASSSTPIMDGTAAIGTSVYYARDDHIHPTDTSRYATSNPSNYQTGAQVTASLGGYLPLTGGTLSGQLNINGAAGTTRVLEYTTAGSARWAVYVNGTAESGGNAGSDYQIQRYTDAGAAIDTPLSIIRSSGIVSMPKGATLGAPATAPTAVAGTNDTTVATCAFVNTKAGNYLPLVGGVLSGQLNLDGAVGSTRTLMYTTAGSARWAVFVNGTAESGGNAGSDYQIQRYTDAGAVIDQPLAISRSSGQVSIPKLYVGGTNTNDPFSVGASQGYYARIIYNVTNVRQWIAGCNSDGTFSIVDSTASRADLTFTLSGQANFNNVVWPLAIAGRQGTGGGAQGSNYNFWWATSALQVWVDTTNLGNVTITSDYRAKENVADLPSTWEQVKQLRPVSFNYKDYTPPGSVEPIVKADVDGKPRWGFIAHELQDTLIMDAATAYKDAPDYIQSPNPLVVVAALTKALQEAMARIEALEAARG